GLAEEGAAEQGDRVGLVGQAGGPVGVEVRGPGGVGAVGAVELPGDLDGAADEVALDLPLGLQLGGPGVEAGLAGRGVLAGQDGGLGAEAVLECIEAGSLLAGC